VLRAFGEPLQLSEMPDPEPSDKRVLIRVRAVGLCGTDLKITSGAFNDTPLPLIPGHEVAGEVVADTFDLTAGRRVACYLYDPCGTCAWCLRHQETLCPYSRRLGFERHGGLAEFISVPRANVLPFSDDLPFEAAAVAMDAVLSPWRALTVRAAVQPGERVVVVGAGGLGLNGVQIALRVGARVAAVDPVFSHRQLAERLGAEIAVSPQNTRQVVEWADGGADVGFESSGTRAGFDSALSCLRAGARLVCCGYTPGLDYAVDSVHLVLGELTILGSRAGTREDARAALRAVEDGAVKPQIMEILPLEEINQALETLRSGGTLGRLVIGL
jgi:propanol-preferring alcohol dehydrogenase